MIGPRLRELIDRVTGTSGPVAAALSASEWHELRDDLGELDDQRFDTIMKATTLDDVEQLSDLIAGATGNSAHFGVPITFHRTARDGRGFVSVSVEILGTGKKVTAGGKDHRAALVALLNNIKAHHEEAIRWEEARLRRVRAFIEDGSVWLDKSDVDIAKRAKEQG